MNMFQSTKKWAHDKYVTIFEIITFKALYLTNKLLRKLIVLKGKNPDYIPPSAPKLSDIFSSDKTKETVTRHYSTIRPAWVDKGVAGWVKKPSTHPVLEARKQFESNKNAPAAELSLEVVKAE